MTAHTPGPWSVDGPFGIGTIGGPINKTWIVTAHNGSQLVAEIYTEANAQLIETAPELLDAANAISDTCTKHHLDVPVFLWESLAHLRTAIARAEGRRP